MSTRLWFYKMLSCFLPLVSRCYFSWSKAIWGPTHFLWRGQQQRLTHRRPVEVLFCQQVSRQQATNAVNHAYFVFKSERSFLLICAAFPQCTKPCIKKANGVDFECSFCRTLTFKISKSFFFFDGSSTQRTICRTLAQGWFFCPMVMLTGSRVRRAASCSVPVGMVADVNNVWCSSGTCSKISRTCCWNPIFSMVSAWWMFMRMILIIIRIKI